MSEPKPDRPLEIAHVLFIDIVGSSKLLINEQSEMLRQLNQIVRTTSQVHLAEAAGDPNWDSFRSNPRFIALLKRIGLE